MSVIAQEIPRLKLDASSSGVSLTPAEFDAAGVREYWIIDRFARCLTVHRRFDAGDSQQVVREGETYATALLPGFELRLDELLQRSDRW